MRILVYAAGRWLVSTRRLMQAAEKLLPGLDVDVLTCPPLTAKTFPYERLAEVDVVYFRLHGMPDQPYMYGASFLRPWGETAFSLREFQSKRIMLDGVKVFFEGCFATQTGIPAAMVEAGATVVASTTATKNSPLRIGPAGQIGLAVLKAWLDNQDVSEDVLVSQSEMRFEVV